jgi:excisionase family DNA binding protein
VPNFPATYCILWWLAIKPAVYRNQLQVQFFSFPENPYKTQQNQDIHGTGPLNRLRYAQHTKIHTNTWEIFMADSREVMNIRQASQYLGVSPDTLYKYVNEQKIPAFKLGNRWRFKKSKLDQWMEEKSMETEPQGKKKIKTAAKAAGTL